MKAPSELEREAYIRGDTAAADIYYKACIVDKMKTQLESGTAHIEEARATLPEEGWILTALRDRLPRGNRSIAVIMETLEDLDTELANLIGCAQEELSLATKELLLTTKELK